MKTFSQHFLLLKKLYLVKKYLCGLEDGLVELVFLTVKLAEAMQFPRALHKYVQGYDFLNIHELAKSEQ